MLTKQEIYDKVKAHLLAQGGPAMNDGTCVYRSPDGKKCAVGCLITDEAYTPEIENVAVATIMEKAGLIRGALRQSGIEPTPSMLNFLAQLQNVHDDVTRIHDGNWAEYVNEQMGRVAYDHGLEA